jgi:hypothetical protein
MVTRGVGVFLLVLAVALGGGCGIVIPPPTTVTPPAVVCRVLAADCLQAIALVRASAPAPFAAIDAVVVADVCPPDVMCDRLWAFDSIVALGRTGRVVAAYEVTGERGPEIVRDAVASVPPHIEKLVQATAARP